MILTTKRSREEYHINPHKFDPSSDRLQIHSAFKSKWDPGFVSSPGGGEYALYTLILSGCIRTFRSDRATAQRTTGQFHVCRERTKYVKSMTIGDESCQRIGIMIHFNLFHESLAAHFFPEETHCVQLKDVSAVETIMNEIYDELGKETPNEARLSGLFLQMLQEAADQNLQQENNYPGILEQALRYIENHLSDPSLSRNTIAEHCGISTRTLGRLFQQYIHSPVAQYIIRSRMEKVTNLLSLQQMPIKEIANSCGFRSTSFLTRQFRQIFGKSPKEYRKSVTGIQITASKSV